MSLIINTIESLSRERAELVGTIGSIDANLRALRSTPSTTEAMRHVIDSAHRRALHARHRANSRLLEVNIEIKRLNVRQQEIVRITAKREKAERRAKAGAH